MNSCGWRGKTQSECEEFFFHFSGKKNFKKLLYYFLIQNKSVLPKSSGSVLESIKVRGHSPEVIQKSS